VGCREKAAPEGLVRLAVADVAPFVAPDVSYRAGRGGRSHDRGGRGVWVHARKDCVRRATDKGGLSRALQREVRVESAWLLGALRDAFVRRIEGLLLAGSRRRVLTMGTDATREAMAEGRIAALVVASDALGRRDELVAAVERLDRRAIVFSTKSGLGRLFGRDEVGVIGILESGIAAEVVESGQRLLDLSEAE
jgi:predicted RNA-binding protein YlxR (DUF448 family)/ribosomal protein L7Ae-like RNA K-turn-binding protein